MAQVTSPNDHYSLLYLLLLLFYPSSTSISILALADRMQKVDFPNTDFPLLLMILRGKLPHREKHAHLIYFKYIAAIAVSGRTYGRGTTFTFFISQQLGKSFFLEGVGTQSSVSWNFSLGSHSDHLITVKLVLHIEQFQHRNLQVKIAN